MPDLLLTKRNCAGFTAVAVITLVLGIGANIAIFSLVDRLLVRTEIRMSAVFQPVIVSVTMPIYEYECRGCRHRFEQLIIHSTTPECPSCQGRDLERLVSMFGVDSDTTRGTALRDGKRRQGQTTRDRNDAEIAYHRKHDDH